MNCPVNLKKSDKIEIAHGGGGKMSENLIKEIFIKNFSNNILDIQHDGAVLDLYSRRIA